MKERIKKIRKELDLTQQEFADKIGVKRGAIANYEIGRNDPTDAIISLICREFDVSEEWLRTGSGTMFIERSRDEQIAAMVGKILGEESDTFKKRFIAMLCSLNEDQWGLLEDMAQELINLSQKERD